MVIQDVVDNVDDLQHMQTLKMYTMQPMDDNDTKFLVFHKLAYETLQAWAVAGAKMDSYWLQWRKWTCSVLKPLQPTSQLKKILQVNTILDHVTLMTQFSAFWSTFHVIEDHELGEIQYRYKRKLNTWNKRPGHGHKGWLWSLHAYIPCQKNRPCSHSRWAYNIGWKRLTSNKNSITP